MAPGIDMNDRNAWDDSYLIKSWDATVKEYEVASSIIDFNHCLTMSRSITASTSPESV